MRQPQTFLGSKRQIEGANAGDREFSIKGSGIKGSESMKRSNTGSARVGLGAERTACTAIRFGTGDRTTAGLRCEWRGMTRVMRFASSPHPTRTYVKNYGGEPHIILRVILVFEGF